MDDALAEVQEANEAMRAYDAGRRAVWLQRAEAIQRALDEGATLAEIGRLLDVSPERVRQMKDRGEE